MDQQPNQQPSMDLPAPQVEQGKSSDEIASPGVDVSEAQLAGQADQPGSAAPSANPLNDPGAAAMPSPMVPDPALTVPATPPAGSNLMADDGDLIEKEWVLKAKHIVEQTKHDPHEQNKAVNRVKADYLKQRYNKDMKVNEE